MTNLKVQLTLTEEALGMSPANADIYTQYIGSKSPDASTIEDEVASVGIEEVLNQQTTIFPHDKEGRRFVYDYQIKGMFKDSCGMLSRLAVREAEDGKKTPKKKALTESAKITAYKKTIDGLIFVSPRKIFFDVATDEEVGICQRPLRASTPQGERIALASSETIPEGSKLTFTVTCLDDSHVPAVKEWLDYGLLRGLGQWRNSGKGRFTYQILEETHSGGISFVAANGATSS